MREGAPSDAVEGHPDVGAVGQDFGRSGYDGLARAGPNEGAVSRGPPAAGWSGDRGAALPGGGAAARVGPRVGRRRSRHRLSARIEGVLLDGIGLLLAVFLLLVWTEGTDHLHFVGLLFLTGVAAWIVAAQHRSVATVLTERNPRLLLAPVSASLAVVVLEAATHEYYSIASLALFAGAWLLWMAMVRSLGIRRRPALTMLVPGSPPYLRDLRSLADVTVRRSDTPPDQFGGIDVVVTEPMEHYSREWIQWFVHADLAGVRLLAAPLVLEHLTGRAPVEALEGRWAEGVLLRQTSYPTWKRLLDIVFVVLISPFLLVLCGAVCLVVLASSGSPVLFVQRRAGKGGVPFTMYKFRSMRADAESLGPSFAGESDPRVTRVGRVLRKMRLDELPQFWNVLKGDMSIIGPRPEQVGFSTDFEARLAHYRLRQLVRPGISGWAQVMQGYTADEASTSEKLRYDLYYVRHRSFGLDLEILMRTVGIVFTGFGSR